MSAWPPLPSRAATQQPQRSYRAARISYFIATRYKKYAQGGASFTPVYNEARGKSISLVSCESLAKVEELFDDLTFCKGENIIPTHFVDSTAVVLDPISLDVYDHFKTAFETFKSKGKPTSEWWKEICSNFTLPIGDIVKPLIHIFSLNSYCGNVIERSVVRRNDEGSVVGAQLTFVKKLPRGTTSGGLG